MARVADGLRLATTEAVSAPDIVSLRPRYLGRFARLTVGATVLAGLVAVLAMLRTDQDDASAVGGDDAGRPTTSAARTFDPTWTLAAEPVERIGYRNGREHTFEVVPLGPEAIEVEVGTARAFLAMRAAAAEAGVELRLESGFRTAEQQRALYRAWRSGRGNKAARPGRSNHQSGRALDIAVNSVPGALAWLEANAASFGFKRTVKREPWHWEYVEGPIARATKRVKQKAARPANVVRVTKRPQRRPTASATVPRSSTRRVATSPR